MKQIKHWKTLTYTKSILADKNWFLALFLFYLYIFFVAAILFWKPQPQTISHSRFTRLFFFSNIYSLFFCWSFWKSTYVKCSFLKKSVFLFFVPILSLFIFFACALFVSVDCRVLGSAVQKHKNSTEKTLRWCILYDFNQKKKTNRKRKIKKGE